MPHSFQIRSGDKVLNITIPSAPALRYDWIEEFDPSTDITIEKTEASSFAVVSSLTSAWMFASNSSISTENLIEISGAGLLDVESDVNDVWFEANLSALGSANLIQHVSSSTVIYLQNEINSDWFVMTTSAVQDGVIIELSAGVTIDVSGLNEEWLNWSYS